ncbi:MAG: hypothetical protein ACLFTT_01320 [Candidatus Hydrogenedentota bacterium]
MVGQMRKRGGYILFETIVALGVLSVSIFTIYQGTRQALFLRARAEDFTTAQFLLEQVLEKQLLQYQLTESRGRGRFPGADRRFSYTWEISKVEVPLPPLPQQLPEEARARFLEQYKRFMGKLSVVISWRRSGMDYEIKAEELMPPEQIWLPEAVQEQQ